jgi:hypothetical protein
VANLPFVVKPRLAPIIEEIGTPESGIILVERRGYLTTGERNTVQQYLQSDSSATIMIKLARAAARKYDVPLDKAYAGVSSAMSGSCLVGDKICNDILNDFAEEIQDVMTELMQVQARMEMVQALALITQRVDPSFEVAKITEIHPDIIDQLSKLYQDEENKSVERLESMIEAKEVLSIEEIEKKPARKKADG